jgi:transcriptional regulator with GAF, ATPase, and Fis domain
LGPEVLVDLVGYTWPGNVRELEHVMQRAVILCPAGTIRREDIRVETERQPEDTADWMLPLEELERRHIREVLEHTGWTLKGPHGAAAILRLPESTLRGRMKKLGIVRSQDRHRAP